MTIQEKIASDLRITGPFSTHDTEAQAQAKSIQSGGRVQKWQGSYAPPAVKGMRFFMEIWVCVD